MSKTWFITGTSRGLGRAFTQAALERGDRVAATARNTAALAGLVDAFGDAVLALPLDVTDRTSIDAAVTAAHAHFGRLDVVVNNAGYGLLGMIEEVSETQLRDQLETNFFGAFRVTQAVLPILRAQGHGHLVQISSVGGVTAFPYLGGYYASKWALEGLSEALAREVAPFGIDVTLIEPGLFDTGGMAANVRADPLPAYDQVRAVFFAGNANQQAGDPAAAAAALLRVVDADQPPLRVLFGTGLAPMVQHVYADRLATWADWEQVGAAAQH
ncbi:SDR family NAD(P)-dependent oxidoreductase [Actinoplanes sp. L3-i22]|uniref:SDR family NAD(P)-dependent oxidoreductase n=1 Tax=Actinoplanes sp. L3-i22 TaxID=2836373 RepID=UPI001C79684C|nr:SDR family NAD(P)-dependent oxidoreductase [Actinoplanes sp. L3-i22]BCY09198.1 short-chain dehydrogenase/reductase [Actinoplanes sp. L3-i22]